MKAQSESGQLLMTMGTIELVSKVVVAATGGCFLAGLISTNIYLLRWGIVDFSIVKTKFVLTGAVFFIIHGFLYIPIRALWSIIQMSFEPGRPVSWRKALIGLLLTLMLLAVTLVIAWLLAVSLINKDYSPFSQLIVIDWPSLWPFAVLYPTLVSHTFSLLPQSSAP